MKLAQYRLEALVRQRNRLRVCLVAAGMLHGGAIALLHPWVRHSTFSDPIQFIVIEQPDSSPTSASFTSSVNSSAPSKIKTTQPIASTFIGITQSSSDFSAPQMKSPSPVISTPQPVATKDKVWGAYLATLRRQLYQRWQDTPLTRSDRLVKVRFIIDRQGYLADLELIESSGDKTADHDAIRTVRAAAPFAPLPIASKEDRLRVTFTFENPVFDE